MTVWITSIAQGVVYVLVAPLVVGVLHWAKARLQKRQGPRPLQPYLDLFKLLRKKPVIPTTASWVFVTAPAVLFVSYALLGGLIPIAGNVSLPLGDFLLIVYLLGLARFTIALAGMDTGSPFAMLGSSREMFVNFLVEPTFVLVVYALALQWRTSGLSAVVAALADDAYVNVLTNPTLLLVLLALAMVGLAEAGRLPFDNPDSHLELTMFGKAINLEFAGPHLALVEWAEAMRLTFFLTLLADLLLPDLLARPGNVLPFLLALALYPFKLLVLTLVLALWEASKVKIRLRSIVEPAGLALVFALIAVVVSMVRRYL